MGYTTDFTKMRTTAMSDDTLQSPNRFDDGWLPDACTDILTAEIAMSDSRDYEGLSKEILRENLPRLTAAMVHIGMYDINSAVRLSAQKYIMDRVLGKDNTIGEEDPIANIANTLSKIMENSPS